MNDNQLVTQSYVLLDNTKEFILEYYLFSEHDLNGIRKYGLTVKEKYEDYITSESTVVCENEDTVLKLIHCFAKNFVFPYSIGEIINDLKQVNFYI